jgi:two-component system response regulator FixJ
LEAGLKSADPLVGYFSRHQDCLEKLAAKPCDVLIVDLDDSGMEGLDLLKQARRMAPWISTMAIVEHAAVPMAVEAVKAGACECLEKPVSADRLWEAIESQLTRMASMPRSRRALTQMEVQILQLILAGRTSQEIAAHLHRSKRTIDVHRKNIMRKLQACSLVDLIKRALRMGLGDAHGGEDAPPETKS